MSLNLCAQPHRVFRECYVVFMRFILVAFLLLPPVPAGAALELVGVGSPITIEVSPNQMITAESEVTLTAKSFLIDIDRAVIAWLVDGKRIESADNAPSLKTTVGAVGTEKEVTVLVQGVNGLVAESSVTLRPVEMELLWESDGYTPPLYRGRPLPTPGTSIIAHAEARFVRTNGVRIPAKDIIYSWSANGVRIGELSGRGRSSAKIPVTDLYGDAIISVDSVSPDSAFHAVRTARAPRIEPRIVLYRAHPLLGVDYRNAITADAQFDDSEITFAALPFFSSARSPFDTGLSYGWTVGGKSVPADKTNPFLLTLSLAEKTFGQTAISVLLSSSYNILQTAEQEWFISLQGAGSRDNKNPFVDENRL